MNKLFNIGAKTIIVTLLIPFFIACNKNTTKLFDVPAEVQTAFQTKFPAVKKVTWDKELENYEAEYEENGLEKSVVFDTKGNIVRSETEYDVNQLPANIMAYITEHYSGYDVEEAEFGQTAETTFYEIEIESKGEEKEILFDGDGNFLSDAGDEDEGDAPDEDDND